MWNWKSFNLSTLILLLLLTVNPLMAQEGGAELIAYSPDQSMQLRAKQTLGRVRLNLTEPQGKGELHSWEIKDFELETVQFTKSYPKRLLLASKDTIYVYDLSDGQKKLILTQPVGTGKTIVDAGFAEDDQEIYWSTEKTVLSSNIKKPKPQVLLESKGNEIIQDITPLKDKRIVVSKVGQTDLTLINTKKPEAPSILKGHDQSVVGVASPDGQNLYSLDEDDKLARWDLLNKEISLEQKLSAKTDQALSMNLGSKGKHILVQYKGDKKDEGTKYSIESIEGLDPKGTLVTFVGGFGKRLVVSQEKSIYSAFNQTEEPSPLKPHEDKISYYKLAAIEAENQNFEAALNYIKQVSLTSKDYSASRKLQRDVYSQLEAKAKLQGAMDHFTNGSYDSAEILVQATLAKYPDHKMALSYQKMIASKQRELLIQDLISVFIGLGSIGLMLLFFLRQKKKANRQASAPKPKASKSGATKRKEFVLLYQQIRAQLAKAKEHDRKHVMTATWQAITAQLEIIEKKSRLPQVNYLRLTEELTTLSTDLTQRIRELKGKASQKKKQSHKQQTKQKPPQADNDPDFVDYYSFLGVKVTATEAEIKKAYRTKIKEYHPDAHDASTFDWVKEEASRMTRMLGEGYETLKDPKKRASYDIKRKQKGY